MAALLLSSLLLVAVLVARSSADVFLQHSFDGYNFEDLGRIEVDVQDDEGSLRGALHRNTFKDYQLQQLEDVVKSDGLYTIRATRAGTSASVSTTLPAACYVQHLLSEQWQLSVDNDGGLIGLAVTVPDSCSAKAALQLVQKGAQQLQERAEEPYEVAVVTPVVVAGPPRTTAMDAQLPGGAQAPAQQQQQQQAASAGAAGSQGGNSTTGAPPQDNRTWFQKNMLFVVAGGFMILNIVAKVVAGDLPQQGQGPPPGRAPQRR